MTDGQTDRRTDMVKLCGPSQQVELRKNDFILLLARSRVRPLAPLVEVRSS